MMLMGICVASVMAQSQQELIEAYRNGVLTQSQIDNAQKQRNATSVNRLRSNVSQVNVADDVKFYKTYIENGKKLKKVAEVYDVPENIILARAFELGKYHDYIGNIANKKGEEKMGEIEILDVMQVEPKVSGKTEDKKVDENTVKAIGRITQLLELTEEQEKTIEKQAKDIETKSNEISSLELTVKDKNNRIDELKDEVKRKEEEIKKQESIIASMEKEIDSYRAEIKRLSMYKDNYEKIINFLNQNTEENAAK